MIDSILLKYVISKTKYISLRVQYHNEVELFVSPNIQIEDLLIGICKLI
jgi:hypothetical protein